MDGEFRYFDWLDYVVFGGMLVISALIGVYFAFFAKQKQNNTSEYLMGSKQMGIFPISMSLAASSISGISILGLPSEMYTYGTQLWVMIFSEVIIAIVMATVYIPVFYNLQIYSSYEYLNLRFNSTVRSLGSILFICKMMLYIPIVIYVPAMAFAQVSGFSQDVLIPSVCLVCVFYTSVGGIKAVVWTDTLQMILMLIGSITVAIMGTVSVGGFKNVYEKNQQSERIDFFNSSFDLTIRHTVWNVFFGKMFQHLAASTINQAMVQRCLALPSLSKARLTIAIFEVGVVIIVSLCCYTGLVIYTAFANCDPVSTGTVEKADQLLPYFVMKITSHVPALPGIFLSGVFSAALSTMSTGLNSMCGVIMEDFIRPNYKKPLSEATASFYMKVITVVVGIICTLLAFIVDKLGGIIQASGSLSGITAGTLLGMFSLGMFFPWANATGAIAGGATAAALVGWISIGSQVAIHSKRLVFPMKPVSIEGCDNSTMLNYLNLKSKIVPEPSMEPPFALYTISYLYYTIIGTLTALTVGIVVSWITGFNDPDELDPRVLSPVIYPFLKKKKTKTEEQLEKLNLNWKEAFEIRRKAPLALAETSETSDLIVML